MNKYGQFCTRGLMAKALCFYRRRCGFDSYRVLQKLRRDSSEVERLAVNQFVLGSIPSRAAKALLAQLVEALGLGPRG